MIQRKVSLDLKVQSSSPGSCHCDGSSSHILTHNFFFTVYSPVFWMRRKTEAPSQSSNLCRLIKLNTFHSFVHVFFSIYPTRYCRRNTRFWDSSSQTSTITRLQEQNYWQMVRKLWCYTRSHLTCVIWNWGHGANLNF